MVGCNKIGLHWGIHIQDTNLGTDMIAQWQNLSWWYFKFNVKKVSLSEILQPFLLQYHSQPHTQVYNRVRVVNLSLTRESSIAF